MSQQLKNGGGFADALFPQFGALIGEKEDEGKLGDLGGMDIDGKAGYAYPVPVAALLHPQRGTDQQVKAYIEEKEEFPRFFRKKLQIHRRENDIYNYPQQDADGLDNDASVLIDRQVTGGGIDEDKTVAAGHQAQGQQQFITPLPKIPQRVRDPGHGSSSFP